MQLLPGETFHGDFSELNKDPLIPSERLLSFEETLA
jgi:hypothetical protein